MGVLMLARRQFGVTTVYHFLFVPLTIGLSVLVAGTRTAGLLLAGVVLPLGLVRAGTGPGRDLVRARARLATTVSDALDGGPELLAYGATDQALSRIATEQGAVAAAGRRHTTVHAAGAAAAALLAGDATAGRTVLLITHDRADLGEVAEVVDLARA